jgi:hypothetical protein
MDNTLNLLFTKNMEESLTEEGWIRIDKGLPAFCEYVKVLGYTFDNPKESHEDEALFTRVNNNYKFLTEELVAETFIVTHWKKIKVATEEVYDKNLLKQLQKKILLAIDEKYLIMLLESKSFKIKDIYSEFRVDPKDFKHNYIAESEVIKVELIPVEK